MHTHNISLYIFSPPPPFFSSLIWKNTNLGSSDFRLKFSALGAVEEMLSPDGPDGNSPSALAASTAIATFLIAESTVPLASDDAAASPPLAELVLHANR